MLLWGSILCHNPKKRMEAITNASGTSDEEKDKYDFGSLLDDFELAPETAQAIREQPPQPARTNSLVYVEGGIFLFEL